MISSIIKQRVSIRKYQDRPVPEEEIRNILRAAMQAPSACDQQPWEFYVITDKDMIKKLARTSPYAGCAEGAPVVIVTAYREDVPAPAYVLIDLALSAENMWLEAAAEGLGMVFLGVAPDEERMKAVAEVIGLPGNLKAFGMFLFLILTSGNIGCNSRSKNPRTDALAMKIFRQGVFFSCHGMRSGLKYAGDI